MIQIRRAYDPAQKGDGTRLLVDRVWPRGVTRERLHLDDWIKDVAPSTELRKWYQHDPAKWDEFRRRYFGELEKNPHPWQPLLARARRGRVTLIYSAHDSEHNNAVAWKEFLDQKSKRKGTRTAAKRAQP
jgi:uncharacterized protein YeaO (DUF488 family)